MTDSFRLPRTVWPRHYGLTIAPDLVTSTFTGTVTIRAEVTQSTDTVVLNAKELQVEVAAVVQARATVPAALTVDPELERIVLTTDQPLTPGEVTIDLTFGGEISSGLLGFYRSAFVDEAGEQQVLAATQFEAPHAARAAFPCFDEPEFKAVFAVALVVPDGLLALSNGPEVAREVTDGTARVTFGETIPMSTYLVAWVVGPLQVTDPVDAGGVAVRVAYAPGKAHLTKFALDVGSFAITFFADYYGIPYPGEKCDLVALPDFSFGAMENLGCVTFREPRLLLDPAQVTLDEMAGAALTIVHEVAHMWFGDLVTMKWWNGIWLNEAFATFMEHLGVDTYKPEWRTWDDFASGRAAALDVDALDHTRTVEYEVHSPSDADGMFDTLTYQKGGSVLRMLERWLGADAFRAGVRRYLERYQLANTETTDLWDAIENATGQPVRKIMDSWIFQPGFPMLRVDERGLVHQQRFQYAGDGPGTETYAVPLLVRVHSKGAAETRSLLLADEPVAIESPAGALVVLNAGGEGFYRVAYTPEWRRRLLDSGALAAKERFAVVDDLWALLLAGEAEGADIVECARQLTSERDLIVWRALAGVLRAAGRLLDGDALTRYRTEVGQIVAPAARELGWTVRPGDDDRARQLRGALYSLLGGFVGDDAVIAHARGIVAAPTAVDAELVAAAVGVVASKGTTAEFETYVERATTPTTIPQEQFRFLHALGDFPDAQLVVRACELALSDSVRPQNAPFLLQRALRNRDHGPAAWAFVRDNWDPIRARFSGSLMSRMLDGCTWLVDDPTLGDITAFLESHPIPEAARTIAQNLDRLRVHRAAVDRGRTRFASFVLKGS